MKLAMDNQGQCVTNRPICRSFSETVFVFPARLLLGSVLFPSAKALAFRSGPLCFLASVS